MYIRNELERNKFTMSITIQDRATGLSFEIPRKFIENKKKSNDANQICEYYLEGDDQCMYGSSCKKTSY